MTKLWELEFQKIIAFIKKQLMFSYNKHKKRIEEKIMR